MGCGSSKSLPVTPEDGTSLAAANRELFSARQSLDEQRYSDSNSPDHVSEPIRGVGGGGGGGEGVNGEQGDVDSSRTSIGRGMNGRIHSGGRGGLQLEEAPSIRSTSGRRENTAFEVAADTSGGESLIKRHPPKKFQKLEEQQSEANITQELLEEKQAIAERRRKEIMSQRVKSAKTTSSRSAQARARVAESKEVDKHDDEAIESAKFNNDQGAL